MSNSTDLCVETRMYVIAVDGNEDIVFLVFRYTKSSVNFKQESISDPLIISYMTLEFPNVLIFIASFSFILASSCVGLRRYLDSNVNAFWQSTLISVTGFC